MNNSSFPSVPFYFIRHGQTAWNHEQKVMGHIDIPLDTIGIKQAEQVCLLLENLGIERIVTSPLQRAEKTAAIIGDFLHITPEPMEGLSEICWGVWQGKTIADGYNYEKWVAGYTPEGAESCKVFQKRIYDTVVEILSSQLKILIVAHNGVYRALMMILEHPLTYPDCAASNCVPYLFQPQNDPIYPWLIFSLEEPDHPADEHLIEGQKCFQIRP